MALGAIRPSGDFRTTYAADTTIFPTKWSLYFCILGVILVALAPLTGDGYLLNLLIMIGIYGIAALGLNILVGFTGQISLGHAAFFGVGAFGSAWFNNGAEIFGVQILPSIPVFFSIPLAGLLTTAVGMIFGIPAARIKGLYLAIATLASQFILQDFFARADWFSGGSSGALANPFSIFGYTLSGDAQFLYVVLAYVVVMYVMAANLMRTRNGRALVAVRDHYLSAEIMGINLMKYRIVSFGISSFYAGIGGALYAHYLQYVSVEAFEIFLSIQFLAMIIIGGLGSVMGSLMGAGFMTLLPEVMDFMVTVIKSFNLDIQGLESGLAFIKQMAIGLAIILFLIFEPDGLAHRWKLIKAYWKLYPFSY